MFAVADVRWENAAGAYERECHITTGGFQTRVGLGGLGDAGATWDSRIEASGEIPDTGDVSLGFTDGTSLYGLRVRVTNRDAVARNVTSAKLHIALLPMAFLFNQVYP